MALTMPTAEQARISNRRGHPRCAWVLVDAIDSVRFFGTPCRVDFRLSASHDDHNCGIGGPIEAVFFWVPRDEFLLVRPYVEKLPDSREPFVLLASGGRHGAEDFQVGIKIS